MPRNTALITDAAQSDAQQTLDDYANGVAAHINGDWAGHNQMAVYVQPYVTPSSILVSSHLIRMLLTDTGTDVAVTCPCYAAGGTTVNLAPFIYVQPVSQELNNGDTLHLSVYAATSALPLTYQWLMNGTNIVNATGQTLTIPFFGLQPHDPVGTVYSFTVAVTNPNGTTLSSAAVISFTQGGILYSATFDDFDFVSPITVVILA